jgi:methylmalonyl-CoA mutase N-terminal domain/subunit
MNTSMTINATATWLLSLYIAVAEEQGADRAKRCQGTHAERHHQGIPRRAAPTSSRPGRRCG